MFALKARNAVQLQAIGWAHAIPAGELEIGDTTLWNFGSTAIVEAVSEKSAKFIEATLRASDRSISHAIGTTSVHQRRLKKDRLVGVTREIYLRHRPDDTSNEVQFAVRP